VSLFTICAGYLFTQVVADTFYIHNYPVPAIYYTDNAPDLPENIWNHKLPYFPPWFYNQSSLPDCGQASGIYYCMSYEFNRMLGRTADSTTVFAPVYSYNNLCEGNGWYGVSTFDSWNLVKSQGNPVLANYNEFYSPVYGVLSGNYVGQYRMEGYDNYYSAMKNRISDYYSLDVATDEDLKILMHYFDDHLRGEDHGGTAIFYSNSYFMYTGSTPYITDTNLCSPNGKAKVISYISGRPTHSMTLAGYYKNTTIDFNGDGLVTDNVDINGDHVVDRHDNEKTLWIVINSYGDSWQYSMFLFKYDLLERVWNKQVFFPVPDTAYNPELTFKIKLKHSVRNSIKISAGIASDPESELPEKTIDFPVFNFQGGIHTMTGLDTLPDSDILEFGIDITDIKKHIKLNGNSKVFLILENAGGSSGELQYFSVFDYEHGSGEEYTVVSEPVTVMPASVSYYPVEVPLFSQPDDSVLTLDAPDMLAAYTGDETDFSVVGKGGAEPYSFRQVVTNEYYQEYLNESYVQPEELVFGINTLTAAGAGWKIPFAGQLWDSIYIGNNTTISFDGKNREIGDIYPYPPMISSFYRDLQIEVFGGYYLVEPVAYACESNDSCITVWFDDSGNTGCRFSASVYRDGRIKLSYSNVQNYYWRSAGIKTYSGTYYSGLCSPGVSLHNNTVVFYPEEVEVDVSTAAEGEFLFPPSQTEGVKDVYLMLTDAGGNKAVRKTRIEVIGRDLLSTIYPDPFTDNAYLELKATDYSDVEIYIYNVSGQKVAEINEQIVPGTNTIQVISPGHNLSPGIYTCVVKTGNMVENLRMIAL